LQNGYLQCILVLNKHKPKADIKITSNNIGRCKRFRFTIFYPFVLIIVGVVLNVRAVRKEREDKFKDDSVIDNIDED